MIEFHDVNKTFAGEPAVSDLNLTFAEGAFSVLIGTSGSGKSTTLKMINRLVEHDSGLIRFAGGAQYRHRAAAAKMVPAKNQRSGG